MAKATKIICEIGKAHSLSSQDAPITNNYGATLVEGNVYYNTVSQPVIAGLNTQGKNIEDEQTGTFYFFVPMTEVVKTASEAWAPGEDVYFDHATGAYTTTQPTTGTKDLEETAILAANIPVVGKAANTAASAATVGYVIFGGANL